MDAGGFFVGNTTGWLFGETAPEYLRRVLRQHGWRVSCVRSTAALT
jgi:hypothetical protein